MYPFKSKLRARYVIAVTMVILGCFFIPVGIKATHDEYVENETIFIYNRTFSYSYHKGNATMDISKGFRDYSLNAVFGIYLPMFLTFLVHVVMFYKIRARARKMSSSSTQNADHTIHKVSRNFLAIICAFYLCILPNTIYFHNLWYLINKEQWETLSAELFGPVPHATTVLMGVNSCVNPIIYSGVHHKIYAAIEQFVSYPKRCCKSRPDVDNSIKLNEIATIRSQSNTNPTSQNPTSEVSLSSNPDVKIGKSTGEKGTELTVFY